MEFFESKINTCNEEMAKQSLLSDQQEISGLLKSMKAKIDSLESVNGSLNNQIILMNREKVEDGTEAMITMSSGAVLSAEERLLYEKYSAPTE